MSEIQTEAARDWPRDREYYAEIPNACEECGCRFNGRITRSLCRVCSDAKEMTRNWAAKTMGKLVTLVALLMWIIIITLVIRRCTSP